MQTFPIQEGRLSVSDHQIAFGSAHIFQPISWNLSYKRNKLAALEKRQNLWLQSYDAAGQMLFESELDFFDPDDSTLQLYQFSDGRIAVRDNVANFTFLDAAGNRAFSFSNSSQSPDGERESQLASDRFGRTVVLYNPVIAYTSGTGSRAQLLIDAQQTKIFFRDQHREIKFLEVEENGAFIIMITSNGQQDRVMLFDRFGNELFLLDAGDELNGAAVDSNGQYVTIYSNNRIQVYRVLDSELLGSASSRSSVIYASYQSDDEIVIALGGSFNNGVISNPSITAVHLSRRQLARENVSEPVSLIPNDHLKLSRQSANQYRITGLNRDLMLSIQF